jgi:hypothetical protein
LTIARQKWVPRVTTRTRPYIPTRGYPLSTALRRAGYRVPDEVLKRDGRIIELALRREKETANG